MFLELLRKFVDVDYSKEVLEKLAAYLELLQKWNKVYNLTAIRDPEEMVVRHIVDSLSVREFIQGKRIIDVGTGPGLPGIPLALTCPDKQFVLLDSNGKKTRFLVQVVSALGLTNVEVVQRRVEQFSPPYCFDIVITRALSSLQEMLQFTQHLCCPDGIFLAMKGSFPKEELAVLDAQFVVKFVQALQVPHLDAVRHLVGITFAK